jgi:predicted Zn-dependent protease
MKIKSYILLLAMPASFLLPSGCSTITDIGATIGEATGAITEQEGQAMRRTATAVEKTFQDITPEQEYYLGRAVTATVLGKYPAGGTEDANLYLNVLGQTLAEASELPETFGGYHFQILDSEEINAFAAPGGFITVSRGMLRLCRSEDALAAVLAHEIGHAQGRHGLRAIKKSRITSALTILAVEGAKTYGTQQIAELTTAFEGSIGDITGTLMNSGYARAQEREADRAAVTILQRLGYDPNALVDMLSQMKKSLKPGGLDFAKTHPDPADRIADVKTLIGVQPVQPIPAARQERFRKAMEGTL